MHICKCQKYLSLTAYPSGAPLFFGGVCVGQSLVFCVVLCRSVFVLLSFFCHYIVCPSSIYAPPPPSQRVCRGGRIGTRFLRPSPLKGVNPTGTPEYRNGTESFFGLKGRSSVVQDV